MNHIAQVLWLRHWKCEAHTVSLCMVGSGPSADVHRAKLRGTDVAVKVIREGVKVDLAALMAELSSLFKMRHPNNVSVNTVKAMVRSHLSFAMK